MRIIIDNNIWISFVIGKRLSSLQKIVTNKHIQIFVCAELKYEFYDVVTRPKLQKIVRRSDIIAAKELMDAYCNDVEITCTALSDIRDLKDLYLLSLAETVNADYIVTGDKDLLVLDKHKNTKIILFTEFLNIL